MQALIEHVAGLWEKQNGLCVMTMSCLAEERETMDWPPHYSLQRSWLLPDFMD